MKLCWLVPSDRSGGISPVSFTCCRQAARAGYETTLLMLLEPSWIQADPDFHISSLRLESGIPETPNILLKWLNQHPQDVLFFNACEEFDVVLPYLSSTTRCVYVVHDTAPPYWRQAVAEETNLEAIVAVSETVARQFRHLLKQPSKLVVIHNGCVFPARPEPDTVRQNDLIFLGGDNPTKGAFDVLHLWKHLAKLGFLGQLHWFGNVAPTFKSKIYQLPHAERIQVYGHVHRDRIFATAASAKVLLMLSRVEPFGMATIEAMSMGCIPVAWDIETGTKEIITPNETGWLAPLGDLSALAKHVLHICEHYDVFGSTVMEQSRSLFNESTLWQRYDYLLHHLTMLQPIARSKAGQLPILYQPPPRRFQRFPLWLRVTIRELLGRSPRLGYWLRDLRGW